MTSFIDLLASDVWTEADIVNRTEAIIAGAFPNVEILKRKVTGMMLGQYQLTPEEQQQFGAYAALSFQAGQAADAARADMLLLGQAMMVEKAQARLALEPVEGDEVDAAERQLAQEWIDAAPEDVLTLVELRKPPPEPVDIPELTPEVLP